MKARNLTVFRNYPNIDEPMINSVVGYLSLRNIIVFSIFGGISFALYRLVMPDNFSIQDNPILFIITVTPVIIGISLVMIKPKFGSADSIILSLIWINHKNKKDIKKIKTTKKSKSSALRFGNTLQPKKISDENTIQEIRCSDFDELKQLKYKLFKNDGEIYADKLVKCYLDDLLIEQIKTSLDGVLLVMIRPESQGTKKLIIKTDNDNILLKRLLHFKKKRD